MKKSKILALCLSALTTVTFFSACGKDDDSADTTKATDSSAAVTDESEEAAIEPCTISMLYVDNSNYPLKDDWKIFDWIEEATGVTFDIQSVPSADWDTKLPIVLNSGKVPDLITHNFPKGSDVLNGVYLPISDYVDQMPNFQKYVKENGLEQALDDARMSDGKYYMLPMKSHTSIIQDQQWLIRKDIFEKNNIAIPTTLDEVYEAGLKLKEIYPDSTPITNRFGANNIMTGFAAGFNTIAGWTIGDGMYYDRSAEKWVFAPTTQNWKDMLTYVNKLYSSGVLDQEFSTLDSSTYEERIINGQTFMMYDWAANIDRYDDAGTKVDPNFSVVPIVPPTGPNGDYAVGWKGFWGQAVELPADAKDRDNFEGILKFLDWCYTDEAETLLTFGKEGETYNVNPDTGVMQFIQPDPDNKIDYYAVYGLDNNSLCFREHQDFLFSLLPAEGVEVYNQILEKNCSKLPNPSAPLTAEQNEDVSEYLPGILDYVDTSMQNMIFGKTSIDDFDKFVSAVNGKGADDLVAEYKKVADVAE